MEQANEFEEFEQFGDDWMMGGSSDAEGKRRFGLGPQDAAQIAAQVYGEIRAVCDDATNRETFAYTLGYAITVKLCHAAGVPFRDREVRDMAEHGMQDAMPEEPRERMIGTC